MLSVNFNKNKEIRLAYNKIKYHALFHNGIVFGGMVRDEIIATYNKTLFDNYVKSDSSLYKRYWDKTFHPESINRMKIPNDIDIYFNNEDNAKKFIEDIEKFQEAYAGHILMIDKSNTSTLFYTIQNDCSHMKIMKIILTFRLGKTLSFNGHKIEINLDVIINNDIHYNYEPPFNSCDFTCNLFVMVKNSRSYDIRLSKNTGTPLDKLDYVNKKRMELKIIDELLLGRIEFIRNINSINTEFINGFRIMKILTKDEYKITNLLFREIEKIEDYKECEKCMCDICLCEINMNDGNEKFIEIMTNKHCKNIMHKYCFIQYLNNEISKKYLNKETNEIECRCSRRNPFNFKNSYKYSILYN